MRARTAIILHSEIVRVVRWLRLSTIEIGGENGLESGWSLPALLSMERWGQGGLREDDRGPPISLVIRRSGALLDGNLSHSLAGTNTPPSPRIQQMEKWNLQSRVKKKQGCTIAHYGRDVSLFFLLGGGCGEKVELGTKCYYKTTKM